MVPIVKLNTSVRKSLDFERNSSIVKYMLNTIVA